MTYDLRNAEKALPARVRKNIEDNRSVLPSCARGKYWLAFGLA